MAGEDKKTDLTVERRFSRSQPNNGGRAWSSDIKRNANLSIANTKNGDAKGLFKMMNIGPIQINAIIQGNQYLLSDVDKLPPSRQTVGLICQRTGTSEFKQSGKTFVLEPGMMLSADAANQFSVESIGITHTNVVIFPRTFAFERIPNLFAEAGQIVSAKEPCLQLLLNLFSSVFELPAPLSTSDETAIVETIITLAKAIPVQKSRESKITHWRVKRAVEKIEEWMSEPSLSASMIAEEQGISRRRLDQLFITEIGSTIAKQINERRLTSAAADLCDPSRLDQQVTTIAFGTGFNDVSHFSRAFKVRFGMSPKDWRRQMSTQTQN